MRRRKIRKSSQRRTPRQSEAGQGRSGNMASKTSNLNAGFEFDIHSAAERLIFVGSWSAWPLAPVLAQTAYALNLNQTLSSGHRGRFRPPGKMPTSTSYAGEGVRSTSIMHPVSLSLSLALSRSPYLSPKPQDFGTTEPTCPGPTAGRSQVRPCGPHVRWVRAHL